MSPEEAREHVATARLLLRGAMRELCVPRPDVTEAYVALGAVSVVCDELRRQILRWPAPGGGAVSGARREPGRGADGRP